MYINSFHPQKRPYNCKRRIFQYEGINPLAKVPEIITVIMVTHAEPTMP